jgi:phosphatidylglycerol:prolipoprotein diacylglycerol transferase
MYGEISFPGLGLSFNPSRVAFSIGAKAIYWYGIIIAVGFLLAVFYALRRCDQFGLTQDNIIDMLICAVPAAIIGARAYYCIFSWSLYRDDPIRVLYIWEGGLAIYGGVIGAVLGLLLYTKVKKVKTSAMLDIGGLGLLIGQSIGRWGNFMNREAFGAATDSFLRMGLTDASGNVTYYHPTFLYESLWNALGLLLLHFYSKRRKFDGQVFIMYLGWYGLGRVFIEGLRMDSLYVGGTNLRVSQLVAGLCFLCAAGFLIYDKIFREHDPDELYVNQVAQRAAAAAAEKASEEAEADLEAVEQSPEGAETDLEETEEIEENETPATEAPEASEEE